jgi:hypothetical protein
MLDKTKGMMMMINHVTGQNKEVKCNQDDRIRTVNFDWERNWKAVPWKTEKEMGDQWW